MIEPTILTGPIVLLGPPGAGKTTTGALAAKKLGVPFIDLDDVAVEGAGSVDDVFAREGEASFRVREHGALERTLDGRTALIAAGAGVIETAPARALLLERALCVRLDVNNDVALARLTSSPRPWLHHVDRAHAFEAREAPRRSHRTAIARDVVDANGSIDAVVDAIVRAVHALKPVVPARLAPDVVFDESLAFPDGAVVVAEENVARLHAIDAHVVLAGGESAKSIANVEAIARALLGRGVKRDSIVVAIGGGAFLDAVGLACALVSRGVRWWSVPTTLLAQVDAGVGGKTAANVDGKKNVVGAFHAPVQTVIARRFHATLSEAHVREGRAEMLKHEFLAADAPADGSGVIVDDDVARSLALKLGVVRRDPRERGLRAALNLGHTVAHALEATAPIAHGEAVRRGLLAMLALSVAHAGLAPAVATALERRVRALGPLPALDVDVARVTGALGSDKKAGRFVLLAAPGLPRLFVPPPASIEAAVRAALR